VGAGEPGTVPEPATLSSLALLAMGAGGVRKWRSRRKSQTEPAEA